jgi:hypothetical protein
VGAPCRRDALCGSKAAEPTMTSCSAQSATALPAQEQRSAAAAAGSPTWRRVDDCTQEKRPSAAATWTCPCCARPKEGRALFLRMCCIPDAAERSSDAAGVADAMPLQQMQQARAERREGMTDGAHALKRCCRLMLPLRCCVVPAPSLHLHAGHRAVLPGGPAPCTSLSRAGCQHQRCAA